MLGAWVYCNNALWVVEALLPERIANLLDVGISTFTYRIRPEIDTVVSSGYDVTRDRLSLPSPNIWERRGDLGGVKVTSVMIPADSMPISVVNIDENNTVSE